MPSTRDRVASVCLALLVAAAGSTPAACGTSEAAPSDVPYAVPFELAPGETAAVGGDGVRVTFVRVASDSRCPSDANCIHAGEAIVVLQLDRGAASVEREVSTARERSSTTLDRFEVTLVSLAPYPRTDLDIEPDDYVATLRVEVGA
jgi:hypothetical protein